MHQSITCRRGAQSETLTSHKGTDVVDFEDEGGPFGFQKRLLNKADSPESEFLVLLVADCPRLEVERDISQRVVN